MGKWADRFEDVTDGVSTNAKIVLLVALLVLILGLIIVLPFGLLWALKTLFALSIGYTFKAWVACFLVMLCLNGGRANRE